MTEILLMFISYPIFRKKRSHWFMHCLIMSLKTNRHMVEQTDAAKEDHNIDQAIEKAFSPKVINL